MKAKLVAVLFLCIAVPSVALSVSDRPNDTNAQSEITPLFVCEVKNQSPTTACPGVTADEQKETRLDYGTALLQEADLPHITDAPTSPPTAQENEIVMVALPFSSLQLNLSLAGYLRLRPSQVEAIQQIMSLERQSLRPLIEQLRTTRETLLEIASDHVNEKEVKALADAQAALLAKLIVANARMQARIFRVLGPDQQRKLSDLEHSGAAVKEDR